MPIRSRVSTSNRGNSDCPMRNPPRQFRLVLTIRPVGVLFAKDRADGVAGKPPPAVSDRQPLRRRFRLQDRHHAVVHHLETLVDSHREILGWYSPIQPTRKVTVIGALAAVVASMLVPVSICS